MSAKLEDGDLGPGEVMDRVLGGNFVDGLLHPAEGQVIVPEDGGIGSDHPEGVPGVGDHAIVVMTCIDEDELHTAVEGGEVVLT